MPEDRQPRKPRDSGGRPSRPQGGGRPGAGRSGDKPERRGGPKRDGGPKREGGRDFSRPRRDDRGRDDRGRDRTESRTDSQARYDGPPIPEEITGRELDRSVQAQLKSLPEKLGQRVARHLVAAGC